jgi:cysteine desulfurase/selenocysteine lyase
VSGSFGPADARREFPALEELTYVNVSVNALVPSRTRAAVEAYVARRCMGELSKVDAVAAVEDARSRFAVLVGASPDEVATIKNVSEGINLIAGAQPWTPGDNVVLCQELEHPSNVFPWHNRVRRDGVEVRVVPAREGRIPVDAMIGAMDGRTRLVSAPTVGFSPGFRTRTAPLSEACRERGVFFLLDAAQSVGILRTDVKSLGADALAVAAQKGLMAFYGTGFLYCRREVAETLIPPALGRYGVTFGPGVGETNVETRDFAYAPGARRFDGGNYNYLGFTAAAASLSLIDDVGAVAIERHVLALARRLALGVHELGLPLCGSPDDADRGHIVTVGEPGAGGHDSSADPRIQSLHDFLDARRVRLSIRRGVLRFSFHVYNDEADVDRILGLVKEWVDRPSL